MAAEETVEAALNRYTHRAESIIDTARAAYFRCGVEGSWNQPRNPAGRFGRLGEAARAVPIVVSALDQ